MKDKQLTKSFPFLVRNSSARTFSLRMTLVDALVVAVLGVAAGCAGFFFAKETTTLWRGLVALQSVIGVCSCFVILRALEPMVLTLSFADMVRLRTAHYFWTVCLVGLVALAPVTRTTFSSFNAVSASLALTFAAVALSVRFLQSGSWLSLTLAFAGAGLSLGVSVFGVVAAAGSIAVLKVVSICLFRDESSSWRDVLDQRVDDYFTNPIVRSRMNLSLALIFFICAALSFCAARMDFASAVAERLRIPWDYGFSLDGALFIVLTAFFPFVAAVGRVGVVSDVAESLGTGMKILYLAIGVVSATMLINPALVLVASGIPLRVETSVVVLSSVFYAYNILLSVTCLLIDIRCRERVDGRGVRVVGFRRTMSVVYALACLAPVALVAFVAANLLLHR